MVINGSKCFERVRVGRYENKGMNGRRGLEKVFLKRWCLN